MYSNLVKGMVVVLSILVAAVPGLVGCGSSQSEKDSVTVGILTDFTGPGASATKMVVYGLTDTFKTANEAGAVPGVDIKWVTYDQRSDPARVPGGYTWLKGQGVDMIHAMSPTDRRILADKVESDEMLMFGMALDEESPDHPWIICNYGSMGHEAEAVMQFIMDTWDYDGEGRSPRVGHVDWTLPSAEMKQVGIDRMLEWYPDKFDWAGLQTAPAGTTAWAAEVERLKDCDHIYVALIGSMAASFVREARARGYTGDFTTDNNTFGGYWDLVKSVVPADQLYGCSYVSWCPWFTDDVPFIDTVEETIQKYRAADASTVMANTGYIYGVANAICIVDAIKRAVDEVGPDNVDSTALRNAALALDMDMTTLGFGGRWCATEQYHCLACTLKGFCWNVEAHQWEDAGVGWIAPPSLAS